MSYGYSGRSSSPMIFRLVPLLFAIVPAVLLFAHGCQEGPFGRHQIVAMTPAEEKQMGAQAYQEVLSKSDVVRSGSLVDAVTRIGRNLARAAADPKVLKALDIQPQSYSWEFTVVRSDEVNAFCLPGGKVVVYTGIAKVCQTDNGLAIVMGHEIGHALAHHGAERMAQSELVQLGQVAISQSVDPQYQREVLGILGAGAQFGVLLPFSRKHESEADHIGLYLAAAAGYDPTEAPKLWERMSKLSGGSAPPAFASTHPTNERRAQDLTKWMNDVLPLYGDSQRQDGTRSLSASSYSPSPVPTGSQGEEPVFRPRGR